MKAMMMLADYCTATEGKLTIVGGGWSITEGSHRAPPFGIAVLVKVPWDRTNRKHTFALELLTEDGGQVHRGESGSGEPVALSGQFEVGRPPGIPPGTELPATVALNSAPLQLPKDMGFVWRLSINDGEVVEECPFRTRA